MTTCRVSLKVNKVVIKMTVEELAERIREYKEEIRGITVEQACWLNENNKGMGLGSIAWLDNDQAKLSALILKGGDTDQVASVDRSADRS